MPPCSMSVYYGFFNAARVGDLAMCAVGPPDMIEQGSVTVTIDGQPAARMFDLTTHGGMITSGIPNVAIG